MALIPFLLSVPVVGIFTKFDDLITQVFNVDLEDEENRLAAERELQVKFREPLSGFKFPPKAYVCLEGMVTIFFDSCRYSDWWLF